MERIRIGHYPGMSPVEWHPVPDFPGYYASRCGLVGSDKVRSDCKGAALRPDEVRILRPGREASSRKYQKVVLRRGGKSHTRKVHQMVLEAFVGAKPDGMVCRHLDGNPLNNSIGNLVWGTVRENALDRIRHQSERKPRWDRR